MSKVFNCYSVKVLLVEVEDVPVRALLKGNLQFNLVYFSLFLHGLKARVKYT